MDHGGLMSESLDSSLDPLSVSRKQLRLGFCWLHGWGDLQCFIWHYVWNPIMTEKCLHPLFMTMMVQIISFKNESWGVKSRSGYTKYLLSDIILMIDMPFLRRKHLSSQPRPSTSQTLKHFHYLLWIFYQKFTWMGWRGWDKMFIKITVPCLQTNDWGQFL